MSGAWGRRASLRDRTGGHQEWRAECQAVGPHHVTLGKSLRVSNEASDPRAWDPGSSCVPW